MKDLHPWVYVVIAVTIAVSANSISTVWAKGDRFSIWLLALILIAPAVFISFGLVTEKIGLTVTSGVIDSLLIVTSMVVGLIFFQEWKSVTLPQYVGMALAVSGICLMLFYAKDSAASTA